MIPVRLKVGWLFLACACPQVQALEQEVDVLVEAALDQHEASESWLKRGFGKLGDGETGEGRGGTAAVRLAIDYKLWLADTVNAHLTLDGYAGHESSFGVTEGWLAWRPVPRSAWQHRLRLGGFIPPFSLEHNETAWTSSWMPSASILNSWLGEEVHVSGLEYTLRRNGALAGSPHTMTLRTGVFMNNDTSGTLLSWRGWVANDRVTARGRSLPLPDRFAFRPEGVFVGVDRTDPFIDTDGRPGYYVVGQWQHGSEFNLIAAHYDNRADPVSFASGQFGWRTRFQVAGLHWRLSPTLDALAQYASGNTLVGRRGSFFSADNDFSAGFVMLRQQFGRHDLGARYETFRVSDLDLNAIDDNRENGRAWAVSWQYEPSEHYSLGLEFLRIDSRRPERSLVGKPIEDTDRRLSLMLRARF